MSFIVRQLEEDETIGTKLHQMRRRLAMTLDTAAQRTRIQRRYLEALEADDWKALPAPMYTKNFLRTYVKMLGGDVDYYLNRYEEERGTCDVIVDPLRLPRQKVGWIKFLVAHRIVKFSIFAVIVAGIIIYLGLQINAIMAPPEIIVYEPHDDLATEQARLEVSGYVEGQAEIWVDGNQVLPDSTGYFHTVIDLERGLNIVTIEGARRYSRKSTIYRTVVFEGGNKGINLDELSTVENPGEVVE